MSAAEQREGEAASGPGAKAGASISVVIPAYNESATIVATIEETMAALGEDVHEIIVVDDGSSDATYEKARAAYITHGQVKVLTNGHNQGKGHALRHGALKASGDLVAFLDADLDLHPRQLYTLLGVLEKEGADMVIGSKRHPQSVVAYPRHRRVMSAVYYFLIKLLFGLPVRDTQTGIKLFRRQPLQDVLRRVLVKRFAFDLEVLVVAHRLGYHVAEAPVSLIFRRPFGRIRSADVYKICVDTAAIFYRCHLLRYYDRA